MAKKGREAADAKSAEAYLLSAAFALLVRLAKRRRAIAPVCALLGSIIGWILSISLGASQRPPLLAASDTSAGPEKLQKRFGVNQLGESIKVTDLPADLQADKTAKESLRSIESFDKNLQQLRSENQALRRVNDEDETSISVIIPICADFLDHHRINTMVEPSDMTEDQARVVRALQRGFCDLGLYKDKIVDSKCTSLRDSVIAFQQSNSLTSDGVIGRLTWACLRQRLEALRGRPED